MITLPRNLEHLISEARRVVGEREPDSYEPDQDEVIEAVDDWLEKLSRGEFDQALYWQYQGEDCEEDGDWQEALEAYQKILEETESSDFEAWQAHGWLARLYEMLGEDEMSLKHLQAATQIQRTDGGGFYALSIVSEAWYYLRKGDWRKAESLLGELQSSS
jgi:tetratricopeptide (TPR) repeat protein